MTKLSAIVIGSGWGGHSARELAVHPRVELRAIVGRGSVRSGRLATDLGVSASTDLEAAIAEHRPSIAVLAIGEKAHHRAALTLLESGAHLLCAHPVAPTAEEVLEIATLARRQGRTARTDYSFRLRPELQALMPSVDRGSAMRLSVEAPGRWLPIVIDAAVAVAGPVARVLGSGAYPPALAARAERLPQAFPPAILLEHAGGVVTSIATFPHAWPGAPVRVSASFERGRVDARLPMGGAQWLACVRGGGVEEREIVAPSAEPADVSVHALAMRAVTGAFVDTLDSSASPLATMEEEAHLRRVWAAVWRSARRGTPEELSSDPA